ncbi:amino acid ABC transporter permease [Roseomonas sp. HF4]|uniref:amino acid ABC transporter permease n=1 Tax=Roseomonas sp. HF4 TaxID=2562313 RepID=UPI0010C0DCF5|nr:amino acid ABC transporter permease [Roseomonas sp. HF4]
MWDQILEDAPRFFGPWNLLFLGEALVNTLLLSYIGAALGFMIGFGLAIGRHPRLYGILPVRLAATAYVEVFRRIPFLVKLMCVFFAFQLSGTQATLFTVALVTVVLSAAAFAAEIARAGIEAVPAPQWDAAEAMNFSRWRVLTRVVAPQSWRVVLPPLFGYAVGFIKSTSIASQIGVMELTYAAKILNTRGFSALLCFGTILVLYFLICWPTKRIGERLEARLGRRAKA